MGAATSLKNGNPRGRSGTVGPAAKCLPGACAGRYYHNAQGLLELAQAVTAIAHRTPPARSRISYFKSHSSLKTSTTQTCIPRGGTMPSFSNFRPLWQVYAYARSLRDAGVDAGDHWSPRDRAGFCWALKNQALQSSTSRLLVLCCGGPRQDPETCFRSSGPSTRGPDHGPLPQNLGPCRRTKPARPRPGPPCSFAAALAWNCASCASAERLSSCASRPPLSVPI